MKRPSDETAGDEVSPRQNGWRQSVPAMKWMAPKCPLRRNGWRRSVSATKQKRRKVLLRTCTCFILPKRRVMRATNVERVWPWPWHEMLIIPCKSQVKHNPCPSTQHCYEINPKSVLQHYFQLMYGCMFTVPGWLLAVYILRLCLKMQTFLYRYTFCLHENGEKAHENVFTSKCVNSIV